MSDPRLRPKDVDELREAVLNRLQAPQLVTSLFEEASVTEEEADLLLALLSKWADQLEQFLAELGQHWGPDDGSRKDGGHPGKGERGERSVSPGCTTRRVVYVGGLIRDVGSFPERGWGEIPIAGMSLRGSGSV